MLVAEAAPGRGEAVEVGVRGPAIDPGLELLGDASTSWEGGKGRILTEKVSPSPNLRGE